MNSQFLESLLALYEQGSIADAARVQGLTPTAVSQRIKALEVTTGKPLTVRSGKTVSLTEAGLRIIPHARLILSGHRDLIDALNQDRISGQIKLGAISTAMTGIIPQALLELQRRSHDLEIRLYPGTSRYLYEQLLSDELDAVLITHPPFAFPKGLKLGEVHKEELCLIASRNHQLVSSLSHPLFQGEDLNQELHEIITSNPFIRFDQNSWGGSLVQRNYRNCF